MPYVSGTASGAFGQLPEARLIEGLDAQLPGLLELGAGLLAYHKIIGIAYFMDIGTSLSTSSITFPRSLSGIGISPLSLR